jgi:hypothetical protein
MYDIRRKRERGREKREREKGREIERGRERKREIGRERKEREWLCDINSEKCCCVLHIKRRGVEP